MGKGNNQVSCQSDPNSVPEDADHSVRHVTDLVQITIAWDLTTILDNLLRNQSDQSSYPTPFAPGMFAADTVPDVFSKESHARLFFEVRTSWPLVW